MIRTITAAAIAVLGLGGTPALAGSVENELILGKSEFQTRCALCHGLEGRADGHVTELFEAKPRTLTKLKESNGGLFPFSEVYQMIDGRKMPKPHGTNEMPIWGDYFMEDALLDRGVNKRDAQHIVQGRILSVVYYLQSIQE